MEEIRFGCRLVPRGEAKWRAVLAKVLSRVTVLDFTYPAAVRAGELRAEWKQAGTPVGYEARRTELSLYPFSRTVGLLCRGTRKVSVDFAPMETANTGNAVGFSVEPEAIIANTDAVES